MHFSQIGLTEARTFMSRTLYNPTNNNATGGNRAAQAPTAALRAAYTVSAEAAADNSVSTPLPR